MLPCHLWEVGIDRQEGGHCNFVNKCQENRRIINWRKCGGQESLLLDQGLGMLERNEMLQIWCHSNCHEDVLSFYGLFYYQPNQYGGKISD